MNLLELSSHCYYFVVVWIPFYTQSPPLVINEEQIGKAMSIFEEVLAEAAQEPQRKDAQKSTASDEPLCERCGKVPP